MIGQGARDGGEPERGDTQVGQVVQPRRDPVEPRRIEVAGNDAVDDGVGDPGRALMDRIGHAGLSVLDDEIAGGEVSAAPVVLDRQRGVVLTIGGWDGPGPDAGRRPRVRSRGAGLFISRRHAPGLDGRAVVFARLTRRAVEDHPLPVDPGGEPRRWTRLESDGVYHRRRALLAAIGHPRHGKNLVVAGIEFGNGGELASPSRSAGTGMPLTSSAMVASGGQPGQVPASVFCQAQTSPPRRSSAIAGEGHLR